MNADSLSKSGLEIYTTEPMEEEKEEEKETNTEEETDEENTEEETEETSPASPEDASTNFVLENGETKQIDYVGEIYSDSWEMDYAEITSSASVSIPTRYVGKNLLFKGKKVALKKAWKNGPLEWDKMGTAVLGFVTEFTWNKDKADIKISGMDKLMEADHIFEFTQTKRSEVIKQIIEAAGLKAKVDPTGLNDDVIDFSNASSSEEDEGSDEEGYSGEVSADIAEAAKQICKGKKTCLDKAKAIWRWCHDNMSYEGYSNSQKGAEGCFKSRAGNCCDHANVVVQMCKAVGVKCAYEHSGSCYGGLGHVWAVATCDGKDYRIDASVKSRDFDQVGEGCTGTRKESLGF